MNSGRCAGASHLVGWELKPRGGLEKDRVFDQKCGGEGVIKKARGDVY